MCHCTVFNPGLKGFVAMDGGHRLDEEEGDDARNAPEEKES